MKKKFNLKNSIGKKNLLLTLVALVLVMLMAVGVSYSWIEQISNVEMTAGDDTNSPMHISTKRLNKSAVSELNSGAEKTIDLSRYFYESGDMHLSSCYGDGNDFYFPKDNTTGAGGSTSYRLGTKDDANVNYLSISFPISNPTDYKQVFWFDDDTNFFLNSANNVALNKLIRCSVTVDSKTTVYSASTDSAFTAKYHTIDNYSATGGTVAEKNCTSFAGCTFFKQHNDARVDNASNVNKKAVTGKKYDVFNDNNLFVLNPNSSSTITVKIWLEYDGTARSVEMGKINMKLVSNFSKTKKVYFIDSSLYNDSSTPSSPWVIGGSNNDHTLTLAIVEKVNDSKYKIVDTLTPTRNKNKFTFEIPSYYNEKPIIFLMSGTDEDVTYNGVAVYQSDGTTRQKAYHWWSTSFPDTYEDSYFTEFTPAYGTWSDNVYRYYFIDSQGWGDHVHAYMWNSMVMDGTTRVIQNKNYPGENLYKASGLSTGSISGGNINVGSTPRRVDGVFFDEKYTKAIFCSDNYDVDKTPDLEIGSAVFNTARQSYSTNYGIYITSSNVYFDMTSKKWVTDVNDICTIDSGYYNYVDNDGGGPQYFHSVNDTNISYGTRTLDKNHNKHWFCVSNGNEYWKFKHNNAASNYDYHSGLTGTAIPLINSGYSERIKVHNGSYDNVPETGIYTFKFDKTNSSEPKITVYFPSDDPNTNDIDDNPTVVTTNITNSASENAYYIYGKLSGGSSETEYAQFSSNDTNGTVVLNISSNLNYHIKFVDKTSGTEIRYCNENYNPIVLTQVQGSDWTLSKDHSQKVAFFANKNGVLTISLVRAPNGNDVTIHYSFDPETS